MDRDRVVGVDGPSAPGSGYLLTNGLVLTSAHVAGAPELTVFRPGHPDTFRGRVVWRGTAGGRDDGALVALDRAVPDAVLPHVRWGRLVTDQSGTAGQACGLPDVVQRSDRPAETLQSSGTINPGDGAIRHRYVLALDKHPPQGDSPWGGMSGAALFCGDLLAGVVASDPAGWGHARLEAAPAYVLLHEKGFRDALATHASADRTVLEPVEFQHMVEPTAVRAGPVPSAAALLQARREVVPFRHRNDLLDELLAWAELPGVSVRLVHGPGGQGKTRLARELLGRLPARWTTVWLKPGATREQLGAIAGAAVPLLVVVDYAESRAVQLDGLFEACVRHPTVAPIKVLLLARTGGNWWDTLPVQSAAAQEILDGAAVSLLPTLEPDLAGRREGYRDAVAAFAAALPAVRGHTDVDWPSLAERLSDPALSGTELQGALTLHMTALADLLDAAYPTVSSGQHGAGDVEDRLLQHEQRYCLLTARARGLDQAPGMDTLNDALVAVFVLDAATRDSAPAVLTRVPGLSDQPHHRVDTVRRWIADLYPPTMPERPWDTLQPDRLAERFVGRQTQQHPDLVDHLVADLAEEQAERLLTVYTRAAGHPILRAEVAAWLTDLCVRHRTTLILPALRVIIQVEHPEPLLDAVHKIVEDPATDVAELEGLSDAIPLASHALATWAADVSQRLVAEHRDQTTFDARTLATSLHNLSARLASVGRWEESLAAIAEAVGIYRSLAEDQPDAFLPKVADGLINLAGASVHLGSREDALAASMEAVGIYRTLAEDQPDAFLPGLALSLNNLALDLRDLNQHEDAMATITEAVDIRRTLSARRPDTGGPGLADSLNTLSVLLDELGQPEGALAASAQALAIDRALADAAPDLFQEDLGGSLNTISGLLAAQGRKEEALAALAESVEIYRRRAATRPDAILPHLATVVRNLANQLAELDRGEEAVAASAEAVEIHRRLAASRPDAFRSELASSLENLSVRQWDQDRPEEALAAILEAVDLYRTLAADRCEPSLAQLATALTALSNRLAALGRPEALAVITETVEIHRRLAAEEPETFLPDLASSLIELSNRLAELGRLEGLAASTEAVEIRRQLASDRPEFRSGLADGLNNLAMDLEEHGRSDDALAAITEAVDIHRRLSAEQPETYLPDLARSLNSLSGRMFHAGRPEEALAAIAETAAIQHQLVVDRPELLPDLARTAGNLSNRLADLGRHEDAVAAIAEAIENYRQLAAERLGIYDHDLATSLNNLAFHLWNMGGRDDEAVSALAEAVEIHRRLASDRPETFVPHLNDSLTNLANRLAELGRVADAQAAINETYHFLTTARPDVFRLDSTEEGDPDGVDGSRDTG